MIDRKPAYCAPLRLAYLAAIAIGITAVAAACSATDGGQLFFVGPKIEGIRDIWLVDVDWEQSERLLATTPGLGEGFY